MKKVLDNAMRLWYSDEQPKKKGDLMYKHPFYDYTLKEAIKLAQTLAAPELLTPDEKLPQLSASQAVEVIRQARKRMPFNWITGRVAEETLLLAMGELTEESLPVG